MTIRENNHPCNIALIEYKYELTESKRIALLVKSVKTNTTFGISLKWISIHYDMNKPLTVKEYDYVTDSAGKMWDVYEFDINSNFLDSYDDRDCLINLYNSFYNYHYTVKPEFTSLYKEQKKIADCMIYRNYELSTEYMIAFKKIVYNAKMENVVPFDVIDDISRKINF